MSNTLALRLVNWNGRSVHSKQVEFFDFVGRYNIDIAVVTETWLRPSISFNHPNFHCIRLDRPVNDEVDRGGGVLIAIRKDLKYSHLSVTTKVIEAAGISVITATGPLHIIAVYFPGSRRCADWSHFRRDIRTLSDRTEPFFLVGDFNARHRRWNCANNNKAGNLLCQEAARLGLYVNYPDSPTFIPSGRGKPSTLDLVLSNNQLNMTKPMSRNELSSDHLPVTFEIQPSSTPEQLTPSVRCYARANWVTFQRKLNAKFDMSDPMITSIQDEAGIEAAINYFQNSVIEAESVAVPTVVPRPYEVALIPQRKRNY